MASIVFSIYAVLNHVELTYDIFNLVFCIVLISMALQGTLLPKMSSLMSMIDNNVDVRRTFNDYQEESDINFIKTTVTMLHPWANHRLQDISIPPDFLVVLIIRKGRTFLAPNGSTKILPEDVLILAAREFQNRDNLTLQEIAVGGKHKFCNKLLKDLKLPSGHLIVMIKRNEETIIPAGNTKIYSGDTLVMAHYD